MLACEDSASIDCARLIRGTASSAKLVAPVAAIALTPSPLVSGPRKPISTLSEPSRPVSSAFGRRDLDHDVGAERLAGVVDQRRAGLLVGGVGDQRARAGAALHEDLDAPSASP